MDCIVDYKNLLFEKNGMVGIVKFNRPEAMNALNTETLNELKDCVTNIIKSKDIKVILFTGMGKAFIAGADIKEMINMTPEQAMTFSKNTHELLNMIEESDKITIAAINGAALGGGCEFTLSCDIRLASEKAKFGQPEINLAVIPGFAGTQRLTRLIGIANVKRLIFTGELINSTKAYEMGIVSEVVPPEELMDHALKMAQSIAEKSGVILKIAKKAISEGVHMKFKDALELEQRLFGECFATSDLKEGMNAFIEKRKPVFKDK